MSEIFDFLFDQYSSYETLDIALEIIAVVFGLLSVWFSKQNNVMVFPTGMISTSIFVYLLYKWILLGDMLINAYYFIISIYGWYFWTRKEKMELLQLQNYQIKKKKFQFIFLSHLLY